MIMIVIIGWLRWGSKLCTRSTVI